MLSDLRTEGHGSPELGGGGIHLCVSVFPTKFKSIKILKQIFTPGTSVEPNSNLAFKKKNKKDARNLK